MSRDRSTATAAAPTAYELAGWALAEIARAREADGDGDGWASDRHLDAAEDTLRALRRQLAASAGQRCKPFAVSARRPK